MIPGSAVSVREITGCSGGLQGRHSGEQCSPLPCVFSVKTVLRQLSHVFNPKNGKPRRAKPESKYLFHIFFEYSIINP